MDLTDAMVLEVLGSGKYLLEHKQVLGSAIALRRPYVDALSQLQLLAPDRGASQRRRGLATPAATDRERAGRRAAEHRLSRIR